MHGSIYLHYQQDMRKLNSSSFSCNTITVKVLLDCIRSEFHFSCVLYHTWEFKIHLGDPRDMLKLLKKELMLMLLVILCFSLVSVQTEELTKSTWADLDIASKVAGHVAYRHFHLDIYEMKKNNDTHWEGGRKQYVYTPVLDLDHQNPKCEYNNVTDRVEMQVRVSFWSDEVQRIVVDHLKKEVSATIRSEDVTVIPFNKVMLSSRQPSALYIIAYDWETYRKDKFVSFKLYCRTLSSCNKLAQLMRTKPHFFSHLRIEFATSAKTSRTRAVAISAEAIKTGKFFSQISQKFPNFALLTAEDASKLVSESATNVLVQVLDDTGVVNPNSALYNELRKILFDLTQQDSDQMDRVLWNSVFWNNDNTRPDKTSQTFNDIYKKSDNQSRQYLKDYFNSEYEKTTDSETGAGASGSYGLFSAKASYSNKEGFRLKEGKTVQSERDAILKILAESRDHVEWKGDRFKPKTMTLTRLNTGQITKKADFREVSTFVTYSEVSLTMNVVIDDAFEITENQLTPVNTKIMDLEAMIEDMKKKMSDLEASFEAQMKAAFESSERKISDLESLHKAQLESVKSHQNANVLEVGQSISNLTISVASIQSKSQQPANCRGVSTPRNNHGALWNLDRHHIHCGSNEFISSFQLRTYDHDHNPMIQYVYTCCSLF